MKHKAILLIDFDDTIVFSKYPDINDLRPKAKETINRLYDEGYWITINTCRSGREQNRASSFLVKHGIKFHQINENHPSLVEYFKEDCRKLSGDLFIDDKNIEDSYLRNLARVNGNEKKYHDDFWDSKYNMVTRIVDGGSFKSILSLVQ